MGPGQLFTVRNVANLVPPYESDGCQHHGTTAAIEFAVSGLRVSNIVVMGHASCGGVAAFLDNTKLPADTPVLKQWASLMQPAQDWVLARKRVCSPLKVTPDGQYDLSVKFTHDRPGLLGEMINAVYVTGGTILNAKIGPLGNIFTVTMPSWEAIQGTLAKLEALDAGIIATFFDPEPRHPILRQREMELASIQKSLDNLETFPVIKELRSIGEINIFGAWFDIHSGQLFVHSAQGEQNGSEWLEV
jgi:carbonic anhydrase